ncbi:unnamed protein product [Darwinula stevensoni]|uniref:Uncharacterized protein n=1 Tax=Darwinula stevensoni TaxID=69355 RepID=A0A7R9FT65_9CRUS|nr:unnamed protein product [Darwinula stevensoni]CAG0905162.1 unnamed protein product [Darwinula stevensoni]
MNSGRDHVVECVTDSGILDLSRSYNPAYGKNSRLPEGERRQGIAVKSSSFSDGVLTCTFTHDLVTSSTLGGKLDLAYANLYLLLADGKTTSSSNETELQLHTNRGSSPSPYAFVYSSLPSVTASPARISTPTTMSRPKKLFARFAPLSSFVSPVVKSL